jgi:hypothetical protein
LDEGTDGFEADRALVSMKFGRGVALRLTMPPSDLWRKDAGSAILDHDGAALVFGEYPTFNVIR